MRIGDGSNPRPVDPAGGKVQNASTASAPSTRSGASITAGSDVVEFGQGKELLQLAFQLSAISRQHRVEEIRQRLVSGDYEVSSEDVSRAIVEDMVSRGFPESSTD